MASARDYLVLSALWLLVLTSASQTIIVTPILPTIGAELAVPEAHLGWLVTVYAVLVGVMAVVMGPVSDRIGRRRVLLLGSGAMAVALALHGLATTFPALLLCRAAAGACGGMLSGSAVSYVGDYFPYARRGWANGIVMSGIAVGQIIAIPLGRILAEAFGFRVPFVAFAGVMAVAGVLVWRFVPQPRVLRDRGPLRLGTALRRYGEILRTPSVMAAAATFALMYFGLSLLLTYLPQWITSRFALDVTVLGWRTDFIASLFFVGGLTSVLAGPAAGRLSDRVGRKPLIIASCFGLMAVALALPYAATARWVLYPAFAAIMLLFAMRISPLQSLLSALVPDQRRGSLFSLTIAVGQVGLGLGSSLAGLVYTTGGYAVCTVLSALSIGAMALLVWRGLPEPRPDAVAVPAV